MSWSTTTGSSTTNNFGPTLRVFSFDQAPPRSSPQLQAMEFISARLQVLDLAYGVPIADIKKRYRALAREHHPDAGGDPERMKKINAAYDDLRRVIEGLR